MENMYKFNEIEPNNYNTVKKNRHLIEIFAFHKCKIKNCVVYFLGKCCINTFGFFS